MCLRLPRSFFLLIAFSGIFFLNSSRAQVSMKDSLRLHMFYPSYGLHLPMGDLNERFGLSHSIGAGYSFMAKNRWIISLEGNFIFGPNVRNLSAVLNGITTIDGNVISTGGTYGHIAVTERGYSILMKTGKLIPLNPRTPNSGFLVMAGAGFLQHKIRIDVSQNDVPPLRSDYKKGYDRMCNGPALTEFIGYQHLDNDKRLNFYVGIESVQAWTADRRPYSFAEHRETGESRFDVLTGLKVGWLVPVFRKVSRDYYYY